MININIIIHNLISFVHRNQGNSLLLPAYGRVGQRQHSFAAHQLRWHEKLRRRKSEGGTSEPTSCPQNSQCLDWSRKSE